MARYSLEYRKSRFSDPSCYYMLILYYYIILYASQNLTLLLKFLFVMIESDPSLIKELQCTQQARKRSLNFFEETLINPSKPRKSGCHVTCARHHLHSAVRPR